MSNSMGHQKTATEGPKSRKNRKVRSNEAPVYKVTQAQELLRTHLQELGYHSVFEYQFMPERKWRFDIFLPTHGIGIELDGGMFHGGHTRGAALEKDYEKQNIAQLRGYRILRFTNRQVLSGQALEFLRANL